MTQAELDLFSFISQPPAPRSTPRTPRLAELLPSRPIPWDKLVSRAGNPAPHLFVSDALAKALAEWAEARRMLDVLAESSASAVNVFREYNDASTALFAAYTAAHPDPPRDTVQVSTPRLTTYRLCAGIRCEHYRDFRRTGICCGKHTEHLPRDMVIVPQA